MIRIYIAQGCCLGLRGTDGIRRTIYPLSRVFIFYVIYLFNMYALQYVAPYTQRMITRYFKTADEANDMKHFYLSCGTTALIKYVDTSR